MSTPCESGDTFHDVAAVGYFHNVGSQRIGAVPGYDDGGLGLILGAGGTAAGPSCDLGLSGTGGPQLIFSLQRGGATRGVLVSAAAIAFDSAVDSAAVLFVLGILVVEVVGVEVLLELVVRM